MSLEHSTGRHQRGTRSRSKRNTERLIPLEKLPTDRERVAQRDAQRDHYDMMSRVMPWPMFLERNCISPSVGVRMRKEGWGPDMVMLGLRKMGVTFRAEAEWQQSRTTRSFVQAPPKVRPGKKLGRPRKYPLAPVVGATPPPKPKPPPLRSPRKVPLAVPVKVEPIAPAVKRKRSAPRLASVSS